MSNFCVVSDNSFTEVQIIPTAQETLFKIKTITDAAHLTVLQRILENAT